MGRRQENIMQEKKTESADVINPSRFPEWRRLVRITAHIKRLAENIRRRHCKQDLIEGALNPDELQQAETFWIIRAEESSNKRLDKADFKTLSAFPDDEDIIRVGSGEASPNI